MPCAGAALYEARQGYVQMWYDEGLHPPLVLREGAALSIYERPNRLHGRRAAVRSLRFALSSIVLLGCCT